MEAQLFNQTEKGISFCLGDDTVEQSCQRNIHGRRVGQKLYERKTKIFFPQENKGHSNINKEDVHEELRKKKGFFFRQQNDRDSVVEDE